MSTTPFYKAVFPAATALTASPPASAEELIAQIQGDHLAAWQAAETVGVAAIAPLAELMSGGEMEVVRAAKRGLWRIVRHAGRPGADEERSAVVAGLIPLTASGSSPAVRREALWMLSEIGGVEAIAPISAALSDAELREDARMALERIPLPEAVAALQAALSDALEDFKPNLAQSLRARGVSVDGLACVKLVPTKQTQVKKR